MSLIRNDFQKAILCLEQSNKKAPIIWSAQKSRMAYTMVWDVKKGIILLERALTIAPDDMLIMEDLSVALLTQWKIHEAREYLTKVGKESHMSDMWFPA